MATPFAAGVAEPGVVAALRVPGVAGFLVELCGLGLVMATPRHWSGSMRGWRPAVCPASQALWKSCAAVASSMVTPWPESYVARARAVVRVSGHKPSSCMASASFLVNRVFPPSEHLPPLRVRRPPVTSAPPVRRGGIRNTPAFPFLCRRSAAPRPSHCPSARPRPCGRSPRAARARLMPRRTPFSATSAGVCAKANAEAATMTTTDGATPRLIMPPRMDEDVYRRLDGHRGSLWDTFGLQNPHAASDHRNR